MNPTPPISKWLSPRLIRALSTLVVFTLITLLLTATPVQADQVRINQVVQTLTTYQGPSELKLINGTQDPGASGPKSNVPAGGPRSESTNGGSASSDLDALLAGFPVLSDPQKLGVEVVEEAEVEGTICDCGEIIPVGGAFPKWPLLFLAAVPLAFIDTDNEDNPTSTPTPTPPNNATPTPTPPPIPEPASLLLFGTGLLAFGAGLRRRHTKSKLTEQVNATKEEE